MDNYLRCLRRDSDKLKLLDIPTENTYYVVLSVDKPMTFENIKKARTKFNRTIRTKDIGIVSTIQYPNEQCANIHIEMIVSFFETSDLIEKIRNWQYGEVSFKTITNIAEAKQQLCRYNPNVEDKSNPGMTLIPCNQTSLYEWNYKKRKKKEFVLSYEKGLEVIDKLQERRQESGKQPLQPIIKSETKYSKADGKTITRCKKLIWG